MTARTSSILGGLVLLALSSPATAQQPRQDLPARQTLPSWIWQGPARDNQVLVFRRVFTLRDGPHRAVLTGSCDNHMTVSLNGARQLEHGSWEQLASKDVSAALRPGSNVLEVRARNDGNVAGLALRLLVDDRRAIVTDGSWQAASPADAKAGKWGKVDVIGVVGAPGLAWNGQVGAEHYGAPPAPVPPAQPQPVRPVDDLHLPAGFRAELVYQVPRGSQGTWVALGKDDAGHFYASDQGRAGIYRITPARIGDAEGLTRVERVAVGVSGAQGLCWAFGSLYANEDGKGVWRIRDTDGDGRLDDAEHIVALGGSGEHGPHAVIPTEDGTGIYFVGGNHTDPPKFQSSRAPSNWGEDLLLPRQWDARGHARGKLAPGGWVARCKPDGSDVEIISSGYRNQYDIALSPAGEMFTYDADMEWDMGMPWYRPTRLCHVVSGSEFGWRSGTGKWPAYYEDSLPPVLDIGPGSPTGVVFGTGARFPARYQQALFILDWTFGTIYAVHLQPRGASYTATKEHFLWRKPLPVTDAVVGDDGALYFTAGGRGIQSALYRVIYTGPESVAPVPAAAADAGAAARAQRRALEAFHGRVDPRAVDAAWPFLGSADRFLRFAARIAVESQPVAGWRRRALAERAPQAAVVAMLALARQGGPADLAAVVAGLGRLELGDLPVALQLAALRAHALAFIRLGKPDAALGRQVAQRLDPLYPSKSDAVNLELARLLTYLGAPSAVPKTMALIAADKPVALPEWAELVQRNNSYGGPIQRLLADMPPVTGIGFAFILRNATAGWTPGLRRDYFGFFARAARHPGGHSYAGFLRNIRKDASDRLTVAERHQLAEVLDTPLVAELPQNIRPPAGPGREWTVAAAVEAIGPRLRGRDFAKGRNLFHAAACSACHRFDGVGGAIGPDLTTVGNKFSIADLLESIVEPSKVISDQYGSRIVTAKDGRSAVGIVVEDDSSVRVFQHDPSTPPAVFRKADIASNEAAKISQMPPGLLNSLNPEELKDLVAYLIAGGDKRAAVYRKR